jgi:hypothetical protein
MPSSNAPTWVQIKKAVLDYQAYLRSHQSNPSLRRKAFLLDKETIDKLFELGSGRKAIRFYVGSESDGSGLRLFPVACEERTDASGNKYYHDIRIPKTLKETDVMSVTDSTTEETIEEPLPDPYETRPCPTYCSSINFLNPEP